MNPLTNVRNVQKLNEKELELGLIGKKSWHDQYKDSAWVFIGGLPYDLTEGDVVCVFSQYGEVVNINMVRDKQTGKTKGYAFLCYEDQRSTILAVDNLNGFKLLGRTLRVDHVEGYRKPKEHGDEDEITMKIRQEGCAPKLSSSEEEEQIDIIPKKKIKQEKHKKSKKKKEKKEKKKQKLKVESSSDSEDSDINSGDRGQTVRVKEEPKYEKDSKGRELGRNKREEFGNYGSNPTKTWDRSNVGKDGFDRGNNPRRNDQENQSYRNDRETQNRMDEYQDRQRGRQRERDFEEFDRKDFRDRSRDSDRMERKSSYLDRQRDEYRGSDRPGDDYRNWDRQRDEYRGSDAQGGDYRNRDRQRDEYRGSDRQGDDFRNRDRQRDEYRGSDRQWDEYRNRDRQRNEYRGGDRYTDEYRNNDRQRDRYRHDDYRR